MEMMGKVGGAKIHDYYNYTHASASQKQVAISAQYQHLLPAMQQDSCEQTSRLLLCGMKLAARVKRNKRG